MIVQFCLFHYFGGLVLTMPYFVFFFIFFNLSNFGFPGTSNFVGEFLVFLGLAQINLNVFFFSLIGFILSGVYSVLLINRVCFGTLKTNYISMFQDLLYREHFILIILALASLFLGFFPGFFIIYMDDSVVWLLQRFYIADHCFPIDPKLIFVYYNDILQIPEELQDDPVIKYIISQMQSDFLF